MPQRAVSATAAASLETWATQRRRLLIGRDEPLPSIIGRLQRLGPGLGEGPSAATRQRWPECYSGTGAIMQYQVLPVLPELERVTVSFFYVLRTPWRVPVADQAAEIGIGTREFWRVLGTAEVAVDCMLQVVARFQADARRGINGAAAPLNGAR